jgi:glutamate--cysteine ligase
MSTREESAPSALIGSRSDLVEWIAAGSKPKSAWRIGTEHEKFLYKTDTLEPVPYDGARGVRALFDRLIQRHGWQPILEGETIIALKRPKEETGVAIGGTVSLEPGGQFELSGAPRLSLHEVEAETRAHLEEVRGIGRELQIGMLGLGHSPTWTRAETPTMPKRRYAVMKRYMPTVGSRGLDMMYRTCTIQVNLDFADEADMVQKLRVSLALQPIATALFASSPLTEGRLNGFKSMRGEIWRDTDKSRTGNLPFAFEPGMGFERYVDYALDVPMYFIYRDGRYIDVAGASFRDFMAGTLATKSGRDELKGVVATIDDWSDHLTTLFPDVRLKRFLEMRGADSGPESHISALPAFWVGLLYDAQALAAAADLVRDWTREERDVMRATVPRHALATPFRNGRVLDLARKVLALSREGLARRNLRDHQGRDETRYLQPLEAIVTSGVTVADEITGKFNSDWRGVSHHVFKGYAI